MINTPESLVEMIASANDFLAAGHAAALPEATREHFLAAQSKPSPVDRIVESAEALFAVKNDLDAEARVLTAQLASFAALHGWHGMAERGLAISKAMHRIGGYSAPEGSDWPAAENDPAPLERFASPSNEPEPA